MNKLEEFDKTHEQLTKKIKRKYKKEDKKLEDDIFRKISAILSENPDGKSCMKVLNSTDVDNIIKFNIYIRLYDVNSIDGEDIWNHMQMLVEQSFHKKYESFDLVEKLKMAEYLFLNNECESVVENEQKESYCQFAPTMYQQSLRRTNFAGFLNIGFLNYPVKQTFNRLAKFADQPIMVFLPIG